MDYLPDGTVGVVKGTFESSIQVQVRTTSGATLTPYVRPAHLYMAPGLRSVHIPAASAGRRVRVLGQEAASRVFDSSPLAWSAQLARTVCGKRAVIVSRDTAEDTVQVRLEGDDAAMHWLPFNAVTPDVPALDPPERPTRPSVGDVVVMRRTQRVGVIAQDDHSTLPYRVAFDAVDFSWCKESEVAWASPLTGFDDPHAAVGSRVWVLSMRDVHPILATSVLGWNESMAQLCGCTGTIVTRDANDGSLEVRIESGSGDTKWFLPSCLTPLSAPEVEDRPASPASAAADEPAPSRCCSCQ